MNSSVQKLQMDAHVSSCIQSAEKHETKWAVFNTTLQTYASRSTQTVTAECVKISDFTIAE